MPASIGRIESLSLQDVILAEQDSLVGGGQENK